MDMLTLLFSILASLISVVNPLGAVPLFISLTVDINRKERQKTALHVSLYFILILSAFFLAGTVLLKFFGISIYAMRIAGGIVIFMSGFSLLNGKFEQSRAINAKVREEAMAKNDISFTPMAMPMLSGPGSISLLITYFNEYKEFSERTTIFVAIILAGFLVFLTLRAAPWVGKFLGEAGLKAISRIMGFIVMSIGIQYIIVGVFSLVDSLK